MSLKASSTQAPFLPGSLPHIPATPACWQAATDSMFSCVLYIKEGLRKTYMEKAPGVSKEHNRSSIAQDPALPKIRKHDQHLHWTSMSLQLSNRGLYIQQQQWENMKHKDLLFLIHHSLVLVGASSLKKSPDTSEWSTGFSVYVTTRYTENILVCRWDPWTTQMHYLKKSPNQPWSLFLYILDREQSSCVLWEVVNSQAQSFCFFGKVVTEDGWQFPKLIVTEIPSDFSKAQVLVGTVTAWVKNCCSLFRPWALV